MVTPAGSAGARPAASGAGSGATQDAAVQIGQTVGNWGALGIAEGEVTRFEQEFVPGAKWVKPRNIFEESVDPLAGDCDCYEGVEPVAVGESCNEDGTISAVAGWKYSRSDQRCSFEHTCQAAPTCQGCTLADITNSQNLADTACSKAHGHTCAQDLRLAYSPTTVYGGVKGACVVEADCYKRDPDTNKCTGGSAGTAQSAGVGGGACSKKTGSKSTETVPTTKEKCPDPVPEFKVTPPVIKLTPPVVKDPCEPDGMWAPGLAPKNKHSKPGCVDNRSSSQVLIWWTRATATSTILPAGESTCGDDGDVDHVQDHSGQWWKFVDGVMAVVEDDGVSFFNTGSGAQAVPIGPVGRNYGPVLTCGAPFSGNILGAMWDEYGP